MKFSNTIGLLLIFSLAAWSLPSPVQAEVAPCALTWAQSTAPDWKGARIYKDNDPVKLAQVGKVTGFDCSAEADDKIHEFYLTFIDDAGDRTDTTRNPAGDNESPPSNSVSKLFARTVSVLPPPTGLSVSAFTFKWNPVPGALSYALRVHEAGTPYEPCSSLTFCGDIVGTSKVINLKPGVTYDIWIHTRSLAGLSTSATLTLDTPAIDTVKPAAPTISVK